MDFRTICTLASVLSIPFGLAFTFAPQASAVPYGLQVADPTTAIIGRYFGSEVLMYAAATFALRALQGAAAQRIAARVLAVATATGLAVSLLAVLAGPINALGWSSVALYSFFVVAWARLGWASAPVGVMRRAA